MPEAFVHLHVHSPFSFLDGASRLEELVARAAELGMPALAITDHDNLSAAVQFTRIAKEQGIRPILGAEVTLEGGYHLTLLARDRQGYTNLSQVLTQAHLGSKRGKPRATLQSLREHREGLIALSGCARLGEVAYLAWQRRLEEAMQAARRYAEIFEPGNFFIELQDPRIPGSRALVQRLADLAEAAGLPVVATNDVHYARKRQFPVHDVLTCVRTLTTLDQVHPERRLNAELYLKSAEEMAALFSRWPQALANTLRIAELCEPALPKGENLFPAYPTPPGESAASMLRRLTEEGALRRYGRITPAIRQRLEHELRIITTLGVEDYFLAVWDLVQFARREGIRYAGRGSAADSAVAYCLGLTGVDAIGRGLMFERFLSLERAHKPDIDIDFEAERRDDVARYVYQRYGAEHVAGVCTFNTFHARSALRDLGKAMGFPDRELDQLAKRFPHLPADAVTRAIRRLPELRESPLLKGDGGRKYRMLFGLAEAVAGFPRHIGTHLGGLVISREPLARVTPLQMAAKGVVIAQFDKDDVEQLGLIKLDLLSLRTLSAVETAVQLANGGRGNEGRGTGGMVTRARDEGAGRRGEGAGLAAEVQEPLLDPHLDYDRIPDGDPETYRMINAGETVGVFQLESPAQRALQSRLGADRFEDLVASVALIRPGPIKGDMVEPFVARRQGLEPIRYVHPKLRPILEKTYGVVLYQEQVIQIATEIAGFTPGEADRLRRVMTHFRSQKEMEAIGEEFIAKALRRGVDRQVAEVIFSYIVGYAGYGFCEAHAAAFADTAYKTAYLVRHYPAEFFAAILSHQPMGFYPPNTLCVEARRRGVRILTPDVNKSQEIFTVEGCEEGEGKAIRVSLRQVRGLSEAALKALLAEREQHGPFRSLFDLCRRVPPLERDMVENLILAGALDSLHPNRRAALWQLPRVLEAAAAWRASAEGGLPLAFEEAADPSLLAGTVGDFGPLERCVHEYWTLELNTGCHLMDFFRPRLRAEGVLSSGEIRSSPDGRWVRTAGLVIRPHRPPTKSGKTVIFLTLEDGEGLIDVTVFERIYQRDGHAIFTSPALLVDGRIQKRGEGVSIVASRVQPLNFAAPPTPPNPPPSPPSGGDHGARGRVPSRPIPVPPERRAPVAPGSGPNRSASRAVDSALPATVRSWGGPARGNPGRTLDSRVWPDGPGEIDKQRRLGVLRAIQDTEA